MQRGITNWTQINSSWMDIVTASLMPVLQNMKTRNDETVCIETNAHTVFCPSHTPRWFASTLPIRESNGSDVRRPTSSDFACSVGSDNVCATSKASDAAEQAKNICSRPHPSLSKRFRHPTVGPVCGGLKSPHIRGNGDSWAQLCRCGNKISSKDPPQVCSSCLVLEHGQLAIDISGSCQGCVVFTVKSLRRRLAHKASLSGHVSYLPSDRDTVEVGEETEVAAVATPEARASSGSRLDLVQFPHRRKTSWNWTMGTMKMAPQKSSYQSIKKRMTSQARAVQSAASVASRDGGDSSTLASPLPSSDMFDVCKPAAAWLANPWPAVIAETTIWGEEIALGQECNKDTSPRLPRAAVWGGALMERPLLQQQEPNSRSPVSLLWMHASDGATCCSTPSPSAVSSVLLEPQPDIQVWPFSVSSDWKDLQGDGALGQGAQCPLPAHGLSG